MNEQLFRAIVGELIDENPFACRALLKLLAIEFTEQVATLAVTTGDEPRLLVNLNFLAAHCKTEAHVKAVICHEFLHVLLRHTDRVNPVKPVENLACDAVINAIIHRALGPSHSSMMSRYYKGERGIRRLLRPPRELTLELALEYIEWDEYVEVTPQVIRLRKVMLTESERKRQHRGR